MNWLIKKYFCAFCFRSSEQTGQKIIVSRFRYILQVINRFDLPEYDDSKFQCNNGKCITSILKCDNENDCEDNSD